MAKKAQTTATKKIETLVHDEASRKNIPTAEFQSVMREEDQRPVRVAYQRRNPDLDPQLIWRGKYPETGEAVDELLKVPAPPLYIQEKVHPKVLIDDLKHETEKARAGSVTDKTQIDLFADFNGLPNDDARTEFYQHEQHWSNRMILGDSLQVMASLAEREGLRGKVQCVYFDPPYGIKFNSNFQWSTTDRNDKNDKAQFITREPEQVKAFRDTWRDGVHSYLNYVRDRLILARDLLSPSGAVFVQIGDENVHRVRCVLDEVFGDENFITEIVVKKKGSQISGTMDPVNDFILCYGRSPKESGALKFRPLYETRSDAEVVEDFSSVELSTGERLTMAALEQRDDVPYREDLPAFRSRYRDARSFAPNPLKSGGFRKNQSRDFEFQGRTFPIGEGQCWKHTVIEEDGTTPGMERLARADRLLPLNRDVRFIKYASQPSAKQISNWWDGLGGASSPIYVVQTNAEIVKRCILMVTDPGDLVIDPTCGSGTTAYVAEQWGRRWITIDTSRVALALARARIMGARYPFYLLSDSREGQVKEAELQGRVPADAPIRADVRHGFVYRKIKDSTSGSIANNAEIDIIWENYKRSLEPLLQQLNSSVKTNFQEWEVPREPTASWSGIAKNLHTEWWNQRNARQSAIDASISGKAEFVNLYDRPYEDSAKVRVAGPFTVESLSPHRVLEMMDDELAPSARTNYDDPRDAGNFVQVILNTLKESGVQQADKHAKITFSSVTAWPGEMVCAEGRYQELDGKERRAAIMVGPEFGTVSRPDLVSAAREAGDAAFDVLIACAFNFDAQSSEFSKLGRIPVLKARMNADLHMAQDFKDTGKGNLFVIFGEPEIDIIPVDETGVQVKLKGIDIFHPGTGEVTSSEPDEIACWFVDTDYNAESFFVRQAYFLGANDPYKALKTTLKADIDEDAWKSLHSDTSRTFPKPSTGRIAVKVINHLGDEVMKVFSVS
ncbi:site-specific DNA-methyltransferase [Terriglobus sp. RCC_193]|uniref:site-specific DNA-methyltransferase n=1 Tax=Terriglobus sp. RCC_193 TaxID=3239218 RepID=UPI003525B8AF